MSSYGVACVLKLVICFGCLLNKYSDGYLIENYKFDGSAKGNNNGGKITLTGGWSLTNNSLAICNKEGNLTFPVIEVNRKTFQWTFRSAGSGFFRYSVFWDREVRMEFFKGKP